MNAYITYYQLLITYSTGIRKLTIQSLINGNKFKIWHKNFLLLYAVILSGCNYKIKVFSKMKIIHHKISLKELWNSYHILINNELRVKIQRR